MRRKTAIDKIDVVLDHIYNGWQISDAELKIKIKELSINDEYSNDVEYENIIDKLKNDGLIKHVENVYKITFKGDLFKEDGGYYGERKRNNIEQQRSHSLTRVLFLGAMIPAIYYLLEIRQRHHGFYSKIYPFALTGLLLVGIIGALWLFLKNKQNTMRSARDFLLARKVNDCINGCL